MPAYIIVMREEPIRDADAMTHYQTLTRLQAAKHRAFIPEGM